MRNAKELFFAFQRCSHHSLLVTHVSLNTVRPIIDCVRPQSERNVIMGDMKTDSEAFISTAKKQVNLGLASIKVSSGQHIGHFYRTKEEAIRLYRSFIKEGLRSGDTCVCRPLFDFAEQEIVAALQTFQIDAGEALHKGQLIFDYNHAQSDRLPKKDGIPCETASRKRDFTMGGRCNAREQ